MRASESPHCAAVVAAPMRKLWPVYTDDWYPLFSRAERTAETNLSWVRNVPLANLIKEGAWLLSSKDHVAQDGCHLAHFPSRNAKEERHPLPKCVSLGGLDADF